jgi:hypothetical protein
MKLIAVQMAYTLPSADNNAHRSYVAARIKSFAPLASLARRGLLAPQLDAGVRHQNLRIWRAG